MIKQRKITLSNILVTLFLIVTTLSWLLLPAAAFADTPSVSGGLVGAAQCSGTDCGTCNLVLLGNAVVKWIIGFLFMMFAILMMVAGFKLVTSGGNPAAKTAAKDSFTNAIIGLLIVLSAWLMVDTLVRGLVSSDGVVNGRFFWSSIECTTQKETKAGSGIELGGIEAVQRTCSDNTLSATELRNAGCNLSTCSDVSCLTSCLNPVQVSPGNYVCSSAPGTYIEAVQKACDALNSAGGSYDKAKSMGCDLAPCTSDSCAMTCSNLVTSTDGKNYCAKAPALVIMPGGTVAGCSGGTCVPLTIPCTAKGCSISPDMIDRLANMHAQAGVAGARTTEAMPPSRTHKSACHQNGTCIDYSKSGGMTAAEVSSVITAANNSGLRAVYEVQTNAQRDSLVKGGVPSGSILVLGSHISAPHFSIYGN